MNEITQLCNNLRITIICLSGVLIVFAVMHYYYKVQILAYRDNRLSEKLNIFNSGLWIYLSMEVIVQAFVCPPDVVYKFTVKQIGNDVTYSWDSLVAVVSILRFYTVFRLIQHYSYWTNERSKRVSKINGA